MGTPYNLNDALRGTGSAIGRAALGVGRGALAAGRFIGENSAPEVMGLFTPSDDAQPSLPTPAPTPIEAHAARLAAPPAPPAINRAAIRSSDMRAQPLAPGMARSLDIPPGPTDMGTFVSPGQRAESARVAAAHAFEAPEWKTDYSMAQNAQDEAARADISDRYQAGMERSAAEERLRGNPADQAILARKRTLEMENLMPEYSGVDEKGNPIPYEPTMEYDAGQGRRIHRQAFSPTGPTQGEMSALQRSLALKQAGQNPKDLLAVRQDQERSGEVGKLMAAKKLYDRDVAQGKRSREDADAAFENAVLEAAKKGALREGDFGALARLLYPDPDSLMMKQFGPGEGGAMQRMLSRPQPTQEQPR